eukprot:Awhi_evm1s14082
MSLTKDIKEGKNKKTVGELNDVAGDHIANSKNVNSRSADSSRPEGTPAVKWYVYIVATVASIGAIMNGYDTGATGGTFVFQGFRESFGWPEDGTDTSDVDSQKGLITALFTIGALIGALPSGMCADWIGRKPVLMINCVIYLLGSLLQAFAVNIGMMYAGRIIGGFAIGMFMCIIGLYQGEIAPVSVRGTLVTIQQLCSCLGIVIGSALNIWWQTFDAGWHWSYGVKIIFPIVMFTMMIPLIESPKWLASKNKNEAAKEALAKVRQEYELEEEYSILISEVEQMREEGEGTWGEVFSNENHMLYRVMIGCAGQFFQQLSGINAIIVGRRSLLISGGIGMFIFTLLVAIMSSPALNYKTDKTVGILIIMFCALYVVFFAYSWGPIIWVVCAEIYPQRLRGKCMSLTTATNFVFATIIAYCTPLMLREENLDMWGTFLFFTCFIIVGTFWMYWIIPETAQVPSEEMDDLFDHYKIKPNQGNPFEKPKSAPLKKLAGGNQV